MKAGLSAAGRPSLASPRACSPAQLRADLGEPLAAVTAGIARELALRRIRAASGGAGVRPRADPTAVEAQGEADA